MLRHTHHDDGEARLLLSQPTRPPGFGGQKVPQCRLGEDPTETVADHRDRGIAVEEGVPELVRPDPGQLLDVQARRGEGAFGTALVSEGGNHRVRQVGGQPGEEGPGLTLATPGLEAVSSEAVDEHHG